MIGPTPPGFVLAYPGVPDEWRVKQEDMPTVSPTLEALQVIIHEWANEQFPGRDPSLAWMKLFSEIGELIDDPTDPLEWADVFILMADLAAVYGVTDLSGAILAKMAVNRKRIWVTSPTGVMVHVKKEDGQDEVKPEPPQWPKIWIQLMGTSPLAERYGKEPFEFEAVDKGKAMDSFIWPGEAGPGCYNLQFVNRTLDGRRIHLYKWDPNGVPF